jgi:zinc protease
MNKADFASLNIKSLPGPHDVTRTELDNGLIIMVRPNFNTLSVSIAGYLQAGSIYDPEENLGLADFTATTLMRGTEQFSFQEIYNKLESIGSSLGISAGAHTAGFGGKALADDLPVLLETLADVLQNPTFPKANVERVRSQLLTGLDLRAQDTSDMASLGFDQIAYANHPYRFPSDGYIETIQSIKIKDLKDFHQRRYGPKDMVLVMVGPIDPKDVISLTKNYFGDWTNPDQESLITVPDVDPLKETIRKHILVDEKSQVDIIMGVVGPQRSQKDFYPALLGNSILGQFGMMGRIGESVRTRAGLAYYAYSSLSSSIGPGPWTVSAGVDPNNLDQAIHLIIDEIKKFVEQPVSEDELSDVKGNYIGKLPLSLESNSGVASALLNIERHCLGLDYFQNFEQMVGEITAESILEVSQKYLDPDKLAISTAGPKI